MAGHSKWANIKHRKARQDAVKGKVFTKFIREITVAARMGGPSEADNPRLRAIVAKALTANLARDIINRAIQRGAGGEDDKKLDELKVFAGQMGSAQYGQAFIQSVERHVSQRW